MSDLEKMHDYIKNKDFDNIVKLLEEPSSDKTFVNRTYDALLHGGERWSDPAVFLNLTHYFIDNGLDVNFKPEGQGTSFFQRVIFLIFTFYLEKNNYKNILAEEVTKQKVPKEQVGGVVSMYLKDIVSLFMATKTSPKEVINDRGDDGYTPFLLAVTLYRQPVGIKTKQEYNDSPSLPMIQIIESLIKNGADLNLAVSKNASFGNTFQRGLFPIHIAVQKFSSIMLLSQLLEGSDSNYVNKLCLNGKTPLMHALVPYLELTPERQFSYKNIEFLLSKDADVNIVSPQFKNRNVLQMACSHFNTPFITVKILINALGRQITNLDHQDDEGMTAVMEVLKETRGLHIQKLQKLDYLVYNGANLLLKNKEGKSVYDINQNEFTKIEQQYYRILDIITKDNKDFTEEMLDSIAEETYSVDKNQSQEEQEKNKETIRKKYGISASIQNRIMISYTNYINEQRAKDILTNEYVFIPDSLFTEGEGFKKFPEPTSLPVLSKERKITDILSMEEKTIEEWLSEPINNIIFTDETMSDFAIVPHQTILKLIRDGDGMFLKCIKDKLTSQSLNITPNMVDLANKYVKTNKLGLASGRATGTLINYKEIYSKIMNPASDKNVVYVVVPRDEVIEPLVNLTSINMGKNRNLHGFLIDQTGMDHCQEGTSGVLASIHPIKLDLGANPKEKSEKITVTSGGTRKNRRCKKTKQKKSKKKKTRKNYKRNKTKRR